MAAVRRTLATKLPALPPSQAMFSSPSAAFRSLEAFASRRLRRTDLNVEHAKWVERAVKARATFTFRVHAASMKCGLNTAAAGEPASVMVDCVACLAPVPGATPR